MARLLRSVLLLGLGMHAGLAAGAAFAKRSLSSRGDEEADDVGLVAIFDGVELASRSRAFRGGSALAWFGGVSLDLRQADLAPGAELSVGALMGGIALQVPETWRVESKVRAVAGGVEVAPPVRDDPDAPTLVIDGLVVMGGVAVGRKPQPVEADG